MIKKTITFTDYDGESRTEDHYFNLSDAEMLKMECEEVGGLTSKIKRIIAAKDIPSIISIFEEFIDKSYGVKSPDGREFVKSEELTRKFKQSEAYSVFLVELCTKKGAASDFVNALIPSRKDDTSNQNVININS